MAEISSDVIALGFLVGVCFVVVFVLRHVMARFRRRRHHSSPASGSGNVVKFQKPRQKRRRRPALKQVRISPLWLVALAIGLAVYWSNPELQVFSTSETFVGSVTHVRDGDTIEVADRPIRLNGLTCDERGSPLGNQATAAMRTLVSGQTLKCTLNGDRTYDREVGRCELPNGQDIGAVMISKGLCGRCARYDPFRTYATVQAAAGPFKGTYPGYCSWAW